MCNLFILDYFNYFNVILQKNAVNPNLNKDEILKEII